ncbi:ArsC2 [Desulfamplus magnetovallimortis]|uniref:ArsC2 n=1 Tax=Desulfamplus magnetovallimortis TaxID=1246637 RepID=A0A1W1H9M1_9BACT|nr:NAD(P)H-dependent oxidoreductase [Desulfamplus magnetovallimortis]SLM29105.1 ArsC2 [Desulfamplus magnetovallimortis]
MFVLGFSASPRVNGNSSHLLSLFMEQAETKGFETFVISAGKQLYAPCSGCGNCEKKGTCSLKDDISGNLFSLIRRADLIVLSTPVYFYGVPALMKGIIDRAQTLWSRKYRFDLKDSGESFKKGILLSVGATRGMTLFDGIRLTTRYFFDAVGAHYAGELCYSGIDGKGEIQFKEGVEKDISEIAHKVLTPLQNRKKIMFACRENAGRSQMAAAFAKEIAGHRYCVFSAGSQPAEKINPVVVKAMGEKGHDLLFNVPCSLEDALNKARGAVDMIVTMGCKEECPFIPGCKQVDWNLSDPAGKSINEVRIIRDDIEMKVKSLLSSLP